MTLSFAPVLTVAIVGALFIFGTFLFSWLIRPNVYDPNKSDIYECGERPIGQGWANTNIRFYVIALIFLIFEVEVALTFPVAAVYKKWMAGQGAGGPFTALVAILIFAGTLFVGIIYSWGKGDFEWVKIVGETKLQGQDANALPINLRKGSRI